jgi:hypothetical protein
MSNPVAHLRDGRQWIFKWRKHDIGGVGWYYQTPHNVYRLFVDEGTAAAGFDIWVGRLDESTRSWHTVEAQLGIVSVEWFRGRVVFNHGRSNDVRAVCLFLLMCMLARAAGWHEDPREEGRPK